MTNRISSALKRYLSGISQEKIVFLDLLRQLGQAFLHIAKVQPGERTVHQGGDVGMFATPPFAFQLADAAIGARAFSLGGCDEQIVSPQPTRRWDTSRSE